MLVATILVVLTIGVFMAGCGFGARQARLDYEPLIERLLSVSSLIAEDLKLTRAELESTMAPPETEPVTHL